MNVQPILSGEVLTEAQTIRVVGSPHPLRLTDRVELRVPAGLSIAEIMEIVRKQHPTRLPRRLVVRINGDPIDKKLWGNIRPKPSTTVTFHAVAEGGGAMRSIFGILIAVVGLFIPPLLGLSGIAATLLGAAITIGGMMLMNMLFPPPKPKLEDDKEPKQMHSIQGARNTANPFGPVPVVLGRHRMTPLYAAKPYTEILGNEQFLRCLFCWGYGPLDISDLKIGDTPISQFNDVTVETKVGYRDSDPPLTLYPRQVFEEQINVEIEYPDQIIRRTNEDINEISVDISFPQGLYAIAKKNGQQYPYSVGLNILYKKVGTATWLQLAVPIVTNSDRDPIRYGYRKVVPSGQYDVLVQRHTPKYEGELADTMESVYLIAIRGIRTGDEPIHIKDPVAVTAVRIRATAQLNGVIDQLNGIVQSLTRSWTGSEWEPNRKTSNPASLIRHVLCNSPANHRRVPTSRIDDDAFRRFYYYCANNARNFTYNRIIENTDSVYALCQEIAAAGRGTMVFLNGKWSIRWDEENADPVIQHFTPRNSWNFSAQRRYAKMPHAFRVNFINATKNWAEDERIVPDDGYTATTASEFETIEFPGVTDPLLIFKHARFHIAQARLRPETYRIETDWENLVCTRGDKVMLSHDVPLIGHVTGRIRSITTSGPYAIITTDETVLFTSDTTYCVRCRLQDGTSSFFVAYGAGETNTITLEGTAARPVEGDLFIFGPYDRETSVMRVLSIEPGDNMTATLTLVDDSPGISQADKGMIPPFESNVSDPPDWESQAPAYITVVEDMIRTEGGIRARVIISWHMSRLGSAVAFEVQSLNSSIEGADWKLVGIVASPQLSIIAYDQSPGSYHFRVRTLFQNNAFSAWRTIFNVYIYGIMKPPGIVSDFKIHVTADLSTLTWTPLPDIHISHYEIRYSVLSAGVTWEQAGLLVPYAGQDGRITVPTQDGTFLIKAVTVWGVYSPIEGILTSNLGAMARLNVVQRFIEGPTFPGTGYGVTSLVNALQLGSTEVIANWTILSLLPDMYAGMSGLEASGEYYVGTLVDLGEVYACRINGSFEATGVALFRFIDQWASLTDILTLAQVTPDEWEVTMQVRTTEHTPATGPWTEWEPMISGDYRARCIQVRLLLEGNESRTVTPSVTKIDVSIDMDDRIEAGTDIWTGPQLRVPFDPPFKVLAGVAIAMQDASPGDFFRLFFKDETGFTIICYNNLSQPVGRTIDYVAKGYGIRMEPITLPGAPTQAWATLFEAADTMLSLTATSAGRNGQMFSLDAPDTLLSAAFVSQARTGILDVREAADTLNGIANRTTNATVEAIEQADTVFSIGSTLGIARNGSVAAVEVADILSSTADKQRLDAFATVDIIEAGDQLLATGTLGALATASSDIILHAVFPLTAGVTRTDLSMIYALHSVTQSTLQNLPYQIAAIDRYDDNMVERSAASILAMGAGSGDPRILIGYVSIGEAESARPYWSSTWATTPPGWLGPENPTREKRYAVNFWDPAWQSLVTNYLTAIVNRGFDGALFDAVNIYENAWVQTNAGGVTQARTFMRDFVIQLATAARNINPAFKIYVANAELLLTESSYRGVINGVMAEAMYYANDVAYTTEQNDARRQYLNLAKTDGKNVSVVVYSMNATVIADVEAKAAADGYGWYAAVPSAVGVVTANESADTLSSSAVKGVVPARTGSLTVIEAADTLSAGATKGAIPTRTGAMSQTEVADVLTSGAFLARIASLTRPEAADTLSSSASLLSGGNFSIMTNLSTAAATVRTDSPIELGTKFQSSQAGRVTAIRFLKATGETGTHVGSLWSISGTLLAQITFSGESGSGWQQANLSAPVSILANTAYVVSYHSNGKFMGESFGLSGNIANGPLTAPSSGSSGFGSNGVFTYGASSVFPTSEFQQTNYFVDVVFTSDIQQSLFDTTSMAGLTPTTDATGVELGMKFRTTTAGRITGLKYYKSPNDTGTHTASLWSNTGSLLARATFSGETASGWQTVDITPAIDISANTTYVVSYHSNGNYYASTNGFASAVTKGDITGLASGGAGGNGVYTYGSTPAFPTSSFNATNYWADIVFVSSVAGPDTTPDAFSFSSQSGVALNTPTVSNSITVAGITTDSPISISGGSGQYAVSTNGGSTWSAYSSTVPSTVQAGHMVRVRVTSSTQNSTTVSTTLTIGGVSSTFNVTTVGAGGNTWPSGWDDARFANNTASGPITAPGGTVQTYQNLTFNDDSGNPTIKYGFYNLINCRMRTREGPRVSDSDILIDGCYIEAYGVGDDHADGIQGFGGGTQTSVQNIIIRNTKIVMDGTQGGLNCGIFFADGIGADLTLENVYVDGANAPHGAIFLPCTATDVGVYNLIARNVVVKTFDGNNGFLLAERPDRCNIIEWTNVRWDDGTPIPNPNG